MHSREIKLSMFADDMLLFIAKPEESLSTIIAIKDQFSKFAGFRVNYSKSNLLPVSIDSSFFSSRPVLTNFAVCTKPLKYLGVYIPSNLTSLHQVNLQPIINSIRNTMGNWKALPLSLSGRITVIKSVIFPKLSYIFQMLPLYPSKSDTALLRSMFSLFIWQGKRPRVAFSKLLLPKDMGGYGIPDILAFAQSVLFRHISDWFLQRSDYSNLDLETAIFAPYSPSALLHSPKSLIPAHLATGILFAGTFQAWLAINKRLNLEYSNSPYSTLWDNPRFIPALEDAIFLRWREKGIWCTWCWRNLVVVKNVECLTPRITTASGNVGRLGNSGINYYVFLIPHLLCSLQNFLYHAFFCIFQTGILAPSRNRLDLW